MEGPSGICPCCGGAISNNGAVFRPESKTLTGPGYSITFSPNQSKLFGLLWNARTSGRIISRPAMMDELYSDDVDGGADNDIIINVMLSRMRKLLSVAAYEIINVHSVGYVLRNKDKSAAKQIISHSSAGLRQ